MPEPVECEVLLDGPFIQDDINWDTPGGSNVQIINYCTICQSVCYDGNYLHNKENVT